MRIIGRNSNTNDTSIVTSVSINSTTAVVLAPSNPDRVFFNVSLDAGITDKDVFIRLYPAALDNSKRGILLARRSSSNDAFFWPIWQMPTDSIYTGEISAILGAGSAITLHVTEY